MRGGAVGTYNADGTARIRAWNETFKRTWEVKGDDTGFKGDIPGAGGVVKLPW